MYCCLNLICSRLKPPTLNVDGNAARCAEASSPFSGAAFRCGGRSFF